jgi:hypothetical protein
MVLNATIAWCAKGLPVSRWQRVQWQQCTNIGAWSTQKRTAPQAQPPSAGMKAGLVDVFGMLLFACGWLSEKMLSAGKPAL